MSMQIGAAPIGGCLVESEPDHAAPRSARSAQSGGTHAGTQPRHAGRTRRVQPSDVLSIGSALFTGRWTA